MAHLAISLLGTFQVNLDGVSVVDFDSNKVRALLAYLAVEADRPHSREALSALLWPDFAQEAALNSLRNALAGLRRTIHDREADPPHLLITHEDIQFNQESDAWLDVEEFERSVISSRHSAISRPASIRDSQRSEIENQKSAIDLYRGPFLEGFSLPDSAPFEDWLMLKREALGQEAVQALRHLADFHEACGEYEDALACARRQVALEPWLEEGHRQVMRILALSGQRSEALAQYETCKRLLSSELGLEPAEESTRLYEAIRLERLEDIRPGELLPAPGEMPYKGLHYFDEGDAALFFGREALVDRLARRVQAMAVGEVSRGDEDRPLLAVIGASGSGKSSLVRAGLVPLLRQQGWEVSVFTPGAHPLEALDAATLPHPCPSPRGRGKGEGCPLLVIDQFEELFTLCREESERQGFIERILSPLSSGKRMPVVLSLRADFYAHCARYPVLRCAISARQEYIGPLNAIELRQAIEEPASRNGWQFEPGLVELILRDIGTGIEDSQEPGALPLLEHTLLETWKRRSGRKLTLSGYAEAGGVHGAIAQTAESLFNGLPAEKQALVRRIFLRLTALGEGTQDTRRRAALSELAHVDADRAVVEELLKVLADARLVTLAADTAEVAHEALIREWPALRGWLSEDREGLRLHRHLTETAQAWDRLDRDPGDLYRGARLAQAAEWAEGHSRDLTACESEFLRASLEQVGREVAEREARRQKAEQDAKMYNARELAARAQKELVSKPVLSRLLALQAVSVLEGTGQSIPWSVQQAVHDVAIQNRLIWSSEGVIEINGLGAVRFTPDGKKIVYESKSSVHVINAAMGEEVLVISAPSNHLAFSPDNRYLYTASTDLIGLQTYNGSFIWDLETGEKLATIPFQGYNPTLSPDGKLLVISDSLRANYLVDLSRWYAAGNPSGVIIDSSGKLECPEGTFSDALAFSPDGKRLACACVDNQTLHTTIFIWEVASGKELMTIKGHTNQVQSLVFNPDGTRLLSSSYDGTAVVWALDTGKELVRITGTGSPIANCDYSSDGSLISTTAPTGMNIWDANNGNHLFKLPADGGVLYASFSPDGKRLVTSSETYVLQVWDVSIPGRGELASTPAGCNVMTGHGALNTMVWGPMFLTGQNSPDSSRWVETFSDGRIQVRDANTLEVIFSMSAYPNTEGILLASLSRDNRLLSVTRGGNITVWDLTTEKKIFERPAGEGWQITMDVPPAFNPDGSLLATGGYNGILQVWDLSSGELRMKMDFPLNGLSKLEFSPDGKLLAAGGSKEGWGGGGETWVWDVSGESISQRIYSPTKLYQFVIDRRCVNSLNFSPNSRYLAIAGNTGGEVLNLLTGETVVTLQGNNSHITEINFCPDGRYLVTASSAGTAKVWDAQTGEELLSYSLAVPGGFTMAFFTPDSRRVVTFGNDGYYHLFAFQDFEELLEIVKERGE